MRLSHLPLCLAMTLLDWIHNKAMLEFHSPVRKRRKLHWTCKEQMLLHSGTEFRSVRMFKSERAVAAAAIRKVLCAEPLTAFVGCQRTLLSDGTGLLDYAEGFIRRGNTVTQHAWLVLQNKVIDPTWGNTTSAASIRGKFPSNWEYIGILVPNQLACKLITRNKCYKPLLDVFDTSYGAFGQTPNFGL